MMKAQGAGSFFNNIHHLNDLFDNLSVMVSRLEFSQEVLCFLLFSFFLSFFLSFSLSFFLSFFLSLFLSLPLSFSPSLSLKHTQTLSLFLSLTHTHTHSLSLFLSLSYPLSHFLSLFSIHPLPPTSSLSLYLIASVSSCFLPLLSHPYHPSPLSYDSTSTVISSALTEAWFHDIHHED